MTTAQFFALAWDFKPTVILGSAALFLAYLSVVGFRPNRHTAIFGSGVLLMMLTLIGPLDFLGDNYLFSAHMLEHLLLYLAVPPLLLLGLPPAPVESFLSIEIAAKTERFLRRPVLACLVAVGTMWLWHLPVLYKQSISPYWLRERYSSGPSSPLCNRTGFHRSSGRFIYLSPCRPI